MGGGQAAPGSERLVKMAIELDHAPECVWAAVDELAARDLGGLVSIVRHAPTGSCLARDAWQRSATPAHVRHLLESEPPDLEAVERVLAGFGPGDASVLLDLLCESDSLATRKRLFARLVELAPQIGPELVRRARDPQWFARRNMLVLMDELETWPPKWSPASLADDPHPAVRREAFKLMLRRPDLRDQALCGLLQDDDPRARALGLAAATESCPPEAIAVLAGIVSDESVSADHHLMGIRALGRSGDHEAVPALIDAVQRGAGMGRYRLGPKSPVMLAALQALATFGGDIGDGKKLIVKAGKSNDPEIRGALGREA